MTTRLEFVPVDLIDPHPSNPRRDLGDLTELADSIRAQGIRQPLLLVQRACAECDARGLSPCTHDLGDRYMVVIGHRRLAAAKMAELQDVPCTIDPSLSQAQQVELMLLENIQRTDLSPVEEAEGYQELLDLGVKVREIAKTTGRNEKTITARIRLLKLPDQAREKVHLHQATLEDAAKLDALVGNASQLKKAAAALGTPNFRWVIQEARDEVHRATVKKEIKALLKKLSVAHHTSDAYAHNDFRQVTKLARAADVDKAVKAGLPDGTVWIDSYSSLVLIRPTTDAERAQVSQTEDEREKRRAFDDQIARDGQIAFQLRDEFITGLFGRKRIAAKDMLAIVAAAAPIVITESNRGTYGLARWLDETGYRNGTQTRQLMAERHPDADPACWLLLWLHLNCNNGYSWYSAASSPVTVAMYGLLDQLGYPISDAERARVFPEREPVCAGCGHPVGDHDIDDGVCTVTSDDPGVEWAECPCTGLELAS